VQESFDGLVIADPPAEPTPDNVYTIAKQALDDFFAPKKNVTFEIYNFRLARQNVGETTDAYTARLRTLAKFCEFADIDNELKSHLIQTCQSTRLRRYALSEPSWTLNQFLDKARSMEAAERQVKTRLLQGAAKKWTPEVFFAVFSANVLDFNMKFYSFIH